MGLRRKGKQAEGMTTKEQPTGRERNTKRSALVTVAALGALVCVIGGTGLFAALQDSARSGTNSAESDAMAGSADIQVSTATVTAAGTGVACGSFSENLSEASPLHTVTGVTPGFVNNAWYCVKNVGSQQVTLSALSDELTDFDYACTGDEALHGDTTCGPLNPDGTSGAPGELSSVLRVGYRHLDCATANGPGSSQLLSDNVTVPNDLGTIAPGETQCFRADVEYPVDTPSDAVQRAQSDRATWRYKWVAQA
jgi:hypothetical protein